MYCPNGRRDVWTFLNLKIVSHLLDLFTSSDILPVCFVLLKKLDFVQCNVASWTDDHFMGQTSAEGQPTRPTQPFILTGSINE